MASISTTVQLYDKVSAPVNNMIYAIDSMCVAFENIESSMDVSFDTSSIESARQAIDSAARQVSEIGNGIKGNERYQESYNRSVQNGTSHMDGLLGKVTSIVTAYATIHTLKKAVDVSDELTQTTARLDLMNDGLQTTDDLVKMVYSSAQNARGSFSSMSAVVAKFGNNAGDAFSSSAEVVAFAELVQKQMTIAGASTSESANAMLQLSQALGSGVLRGDELNSIFEQAPNLIKSIADYMGISIGKIREMASEGEITADVVKQAIFASSDDINAKFEQMPMTWGQVWTSMKNNALIQFQPLLQKINDLANNQNFQAFTANAVGAIATVSGFLLNILELITSIASFISQNWSIIEPIIAGIAVALGLYTAALLINNTVQGISATVASVKSAADMMQAGATFAATAAQYGFNAALMACPLTWIILLIVAVIAIIYVVIGIINKVTGSSISATGVIVGALATAVAFIWDLFLALLDLILGIVNALVNPWITLANFFGNLFNDPIGAIVHLFGDMADSILGILETIAKAIDKVFGSNLAGKVQGWRDGLDSMVESVANEYGNGSYEKIANELNLSSESLGLSRWAYSDAYKSGYSAGEGIDESVKNLFGNGESDFDLDQISYDVADTASNTEEVADSLDDSSEDLEYLRDIAEKEAINRFTTAQIHVENTNHNTINSNADVDCIVSGFGSRLAETVSVVAEGDYS